MPTVKITQRLVDDLAGAKPPAKDAFYWDSRRAGLGLKHSAGSGRVSWVYQYRLGKSFRLTIGRAPALNLEAAAKAHQKFAACVALGENPLDTKRKKTAETFERFVRDTYMTGPQWKVKTPRTRQVDSSLIEPMVAALGDKRLTEITVGDVKRLHAALQDPFAAQKLAARAGRTATRKRGGEHSARRAIRLLRAIFTAAIEDKLVKENPTATVDIGSDAARDEKELDEGGYAALLGAIERCRTEAATDEQRKAVDAIHILTLTGARRSEIGNLRWRHVQGAQIILTKGEHKTGGKTGRPRVIELPEQALEVLARYRRGDPDGLVFEGIVPGRPVDLQRPWERIRAAAGLPATVVLHSLRHGLGTILGVSGASALQIAAVLGHASSRTSERYIHTREAAHKALAAKAGALISNAVAPPTPPAGGTVVPLRRTGR